MRGRCHPIRSRHVVAVVGLGKRLEHFLRGLWDGAVQNVAGPNHVLRYCESHGGLLAVGRLLLQDVLEQILRGRIGDGPVQTDAGHNHVLRCGESHGGLLADGQLLLQDVPADESVTVVGQRGRQDPVRQQQPEHV